MTAHLEYEINQSARARHMRITIDTDGTVRVTQPARISSLKLDAFVQKHAEWITRMQRKMQLHAARNVGRYGSSILVPRLRRGTTAYKKAISAARELAYTLCVRFARQGDFSYGSISIRNQKTRWGSCSARNALSFNYRLIYLPPKLQEYIVIHELSHTRHHNHSEKFWKEVEKHCPNWQECRNTLRRYRW